MPSNSISRRAIFGHPAYNTIKHSQIATAPKLGLKEGLFRKCRDCPLEKHIKYYCDKEIWG